MQAAMAERQEELAGRTFEGTAGGGMVTAVVTGLGDLVSVDVDPAVVDPDDPELLGDLVVAAVNQAIAAMREEAAALLGGEGLASGLSGLGLDDLGGLLG
ncbi:MAG TPA: YbaB/EbfC family nucleoid-associated protein [Thermoanaerobaculia bacterium]|nr:YbaB/EbfC family nucleoid-associated protein [Thermoanaerobaculia bacterium]